jgi:DNA polymerase-3 subunit beta
MSTLTLIKPTAVREGTFGIDGKVLADAVALIVKATGKPNTVLGSVRLDFRDSRLTLTATDFEVAAAIKLVVKGRRAATVTVNGRKLADFTKALASEATVEIITGGAEVLVQAGDTVYHLSPVEEFPTVAFPDFTAGAAELDVPAFVRSARIGGAAASTDGNRPILTGIYFHQGAAVATNSYTLAVDYEAPAGLEGNVPAVGAKLAVALFGADEEVRFEVVGNHLLLRSASTVMSIKLIEGEYPNWSSLIRTKDTYTVLVARAQLVDALDKVRVISKGGDIPATVSVDGGNMHLSVIDAEEAHDDVELTAGSKNVPTIGVNPDFMAKLLKAVASDNIEIGYVDSLKPVNITDGTGAHTWRMLLMPVRLPSSEAPAPKPTKADDAPKGKVVDDDPNIGPVVDEEPI